MVSKIHLIKYYANRQHLVKLYNCRVLVQFIGPLSEVVHGRFHDLKSHPHTWTPKQRTDLQILRDVWAWCSHECPAETDC